MSNMTKKQNDELDRKISELTRYLKQRSSPKKYIQLMNEIRQLQVQQRYGLVFEEHSEETVIHPRAKLKEIVGLRIDNEGQDNILIEGENLVALYLLRKKYSSKIDVICIDPPYNTGMDWLNYGDHEYKDMEDIYPHSKWLSFINARLKIAYELLSDDGIMFINIDENETGTLLLLCHQLFGEKNVDVLIWPKTDCRFDINRVDKPHREIRIVHEYVFACFKNREKTKVNKIMSPVELNGEWVDRPSTLETIIKGLGTTSSAKDELGALFGDRLIFQTPKPMRLMKELIRFASKSNSIVLDFFAGSGTTGHATMDLNKEDGGHRSFILITNNENDICRKITYKRLKKVIEKEKYKENIIYYEIK